MIEFLQNQNVQTALIILGVLGVIYALVERKKDKKKKKSPPKGLSTYDKASLSYPSGMLWKPKSHGFGGRLIVLTAATGPGAGSNVSILDKAGKLLERGRWHNAVNAEHPNGANGGRMHWLFNKTGAAYGTQLILSIEGKHYKIPNGASRYE